jgi:hypothetical protein
MTVVEFLESTVTASCGSCHQLFVGLCRHA